MDKVFDCMFSLGDAINFFLGPVFGIALGKVGIWKNFDPNVNYSDGKVDGEVHHEYNRSQLNNTEVFEVQIEYILPLLFFFSSFCFLLRSELVRILFKIKFKDVINMGFLTNCNISLFLDKSVFTVSC